MMRNSPNVMDDFPLPVRPQIPTCEKTHLGYLKFKRKIIVKWKSSVLLFAYFKEMVLNSARDVAVFGPE